jgi:hypothetical protein
MAYMMQTFTAVVGLATGSTGVKMLNIFKAPFPCIISRVSAYGDGTGTGGIVTLYKNAVAVSSGLTMTTSTWTSKSFTTGLTAVKNDSIGAKLTVCERYADATTKTDPITVQVDVKVDQWYLHMDN